MLMWFLLCVQEMDDVKAHLQEAQAEEKRRDEDKIRLAREKHSVVQDMEVEVSKTELVLLLYIRLSCQMFEYFSGIFPFPTVSSTLLFYLFILILSMNMSGL